MLRPGSLGPLALARAADTVRPPVSRACPGETTGPHCTTRLQSA
jgi:hypothetical protein